MKGGTVGPALTITRQTKELAMKTAIFSLRALSTLALLAGGCLVVAAPAAAQFRPAGVHGFHLQQVIQQHRAVPASNQVEITNQGQSSLSVYWIRPGIQWQLLGNIPAGGNSSLGITAGDSVQVRDDSTGRVLRTFLPTAPMTLTLGGGHRPLPFNPRPFNHQALNLQPVNPQPNNIYDPFAPSVDPQPFNPQPQPAPQPFNPRPFQPQPAARLDLAKEATEAMNYLNAVRQNPLAYGQELGFDTSVIPQLGALRINPKLMAAAQRKADYMAQNSTTSNPFGAMAHVLTINGEQVGMNKWMRDAGFRVPSLCQDNETNFECLAGETGSIGCGVSAMKKLLQHEPHRVPMTGGNDFWKPCTDLGIGISLAADGETMLMSVVFGYEE